MDSVFFSLILRSDESLHHGSTWRATKKHATYIVTRRLLEHTTPPLDIVHIGIVGLGHRGLKAVGRYELVPGAEIVALADNKQDRTMVANEALVASGRPKARAYYGNEAHKRLMEDPAVDLVYICTDWISHAQLAVMAMRSGKHAAIEVPAAMTVDECRELINVSLETGRHCTLLENCCYDTFASTTRVMASKGLFGEITHCEGAYIHDLNNEIETMGGDQKYWMAHETLSQPGNAYPTHSIGPIALMTNLHRGDRMKSLVSVTSIGLGVKGRVNNTLITTELGRTILLQHDIGTPRPYNRLQTICGTMGYSQKYPLPTIQLQGMDKALCGDEALDYAKQFKESGVSEWHNDGERKGSPNVMNHAMDCRLIHCLHNGLPLDIDVFDAAEWSSLIELSGKSASLGGQPIECPDFTDGHWKDLDCHRFY